MAAKLAILVIRSLISVLLGTAHLFFVIWLFGYIAAYNPLTTWITKNSYLADYIQLSWSVMDLFIHLALAIPAVVAWRKLQPNLRFYHFALIVAPILCSGLYSMWASSELEVINPTMLSYIAPLIPAAALIMLGVLSEKYLGKPKAANQEFTL